MKRKALFGCGILAALVIGLLAGSVLRGDSVAKTPQIVYKTASEPTRAQLLALVNVERAKKHVAPLKESPILDVSAQWKAEDEVKYDYFGHVRPGTHGNDGLDYLDSLDPPCSYVSENLTENIYTNTASVAVNAWVNSPPHYKAMVNPNYTLTGFGIDGTEIVEHFCQP